MSLDDAGVVRAQYATETGLETRRSIYENVEGDDAREVTFQTIAATHPRRLLEVGSGPGELSARIMAELGAEVIALDVSERMVELARGRGVDARVGDVQELPFADASFDTASQRGCCTTCPISIGAWPRSRVSSRPADGWLR